MDKHTSYYKIVETLQGAIECPLCKLEEEAQYGYLDFILYEAVTDPQIRSELVKSGGYCRRHAHRLVKMRDNLGTAFIYQDQIKLLIDSFTNTKLLSNYNFKQRSNLVFKDQFASINNSLNANWYQNSGNELKRKNQTIINDLNCPACRNQLETRRNYLNILGEGLREQEMKQAYESSTGFCIPHLTCLSESVKDKTTQIYLYNIEQQNLSKLWDELQEFIRKHDYRYQDETYGAESDSWLRAIKKLHGSEEVF